MLHGRMLRYLDEIVRAGSIRKAGERLRVSPSAINRQLLALEETFGSPIFERLPRRLRLTAAGELLILHVRQTLKEHEQLGERIQALKGLRSGEVKVATVGLLATRPMAMLAIQLQRRYPFLKLDVRVQPLGDIIAALLGGEVELLLAYNVPYSARLQTLGSYELTLAAAMAPDHVLANQPKLRLSDCMSFPLALPNTAVSIRALLDRALPTKARFVPALETNSTEMLREVARTAPNLTFLNELDVADETARGLLRLVPVAELSSQRQTLSLVARRDGALDTAAYLVANEVLDVLNRQIGLLKRPAEPPDA